MMSLEQAPDPGPPDPTPARFPSSILLFDRALNPRMATRGSFDVLPEDEHQVHRAPLFTALRLSALRPRGDRVLHPASAEPDEAICRTSRHPSPIRGARGERKRMAGADLERVLQ